MCCMGHMIASKTLWKARPAFMSSGQFVAELRRWKFVSHCFFFCGFCDWSFVFFLAHTLIPSQCARVRFPPSFWCCHCAFVLDPNIWNNQTWFNMISVFDDCLMHLHLGNVYQTRRRHEINISARLVFCLDEYFRAEPQIQAGVSMRNEALVDLTPALDMWKSDSFALI